MTQLQDPQADSLERRAASLEPAAPERRWWQQRGARVGLLIAAGVLFLAVSLWPVVRGLSRVVMANWWADQAKAHALDGDFKQAIADIDQAIAMAPSDLNWYLDRARYHLEAGDFKASLTDFNHVIKANPNNAEAYQGRSRVTQREGRYADALADLTKALELSPASEPAPWNNRAYGRALANTELAEGLDDVERALRLLKQQMTEIPSSAAERAMIVAGFHGEEAGYLDTRGYLQHLLGEQQKALDDLNRAFELHKEYRTAVLDEAKSRNLGDAQLKFLKTHLDHTDAVILHHRGLVHRALGDEKQADADLRWADELGYNPAAGVE
ncbi:MAG: tetratricopeptide repeat protein [Pirellulales bacterium]